MNNESNKLIMPDESITLDEMYDFGYTDFNMLPLGKEKALELFDNPNAPAVFCLYSDNTEGEAVSREEIINFKGLLGVERLAWENFTEDEEETNFEIVDCPRMAGDYEVTHSFPIGHTELIIGVNEKAADGEKYLVADCEKNELFENFTNAMVYSSSFPITLRDRFRHYSLFLSNSSIAIINDRKKVKNKK